MSEPSSQSLSSQRQRLTPAVRMGISISVATGLYGISFGALSVAAGLNLPQTMALSWLMFTGGSQFAFIGVVAGGGSGAAAVGAASLLSVRNAIYGMQMSQMVAPTGLWRWLAAHLTIDESAATAASQSDGLEQKRGFWVAGVGVFLLWNLFTLLGALLGDALGDTRRFGLDGAAVAAFLGLLWPRLNAREPVALVLVCGLVTAMAIPVVPAGLPILLAAAVGAAWGGWRSRRAADQDAAQNAGATREAP